MFFGGAFFFAERVSHVRDRFDIWLDTFSTERVLCPSTGEMTEFVNCQGYQVAQSLFAQADGGLFGEGFGRSLLEAPGGNILIPAPHTDLIYSVLVNEAGLFGAAGLVGAYLLLVFRGFKISMLAADGFSKLLAVGLTSVLALQVFVIVGGRHARDPADRRDAPARLLRRQLAAREHGPAGAAPDRLGQRPP